MSWEARRGRWRGDWEPRGSVRYKPVLAALAGNHDRVRWTDRDVISTGDTVWQRTSRR